MPLAPDNLTVVSSGEIDLSIVMPVFRNAPFLEELHRRLSNVVDDAGLTAELVFVNDACPEGSADVLEAIEQSDPRVSVICLDRNVGQQNAVLQGLAVTRGKQVVVLDADLQDPPEAIPRLLAELESESAAAVFAGRRGAYENRIRLFTSRMLKRVQHRLSGVPADAGMFLVMNRQVVERVLEMKPRFTYLIPMIGCIGLPTTSVPVVRSPRPSGRSAYSPWKRLKAGIRVVACSLACRPNRSSSSASGLGWGAICASLLLGMTIAFVPLRYEIIDDFELITILRGLDGFPADAETRHISRYLSHSLLFLYDAIPSASWYGIFVYLTCGVGLALTFSIFFLPTISPRSRVIALPAVLVLTFHCCFLITFTSAMLLVQLGVFARILAWQIGDQKFRLGGPAMAACLVLAYCWRWEIMLMFCAFALPVVVRFRASQGKMLVGIALPLLFVVPVDRVWNALATNSPEHHSYDRFNDLRRQFHDTPRGMRGPNTDTALQAAGWDNDDYTAFQEWFLFDDEVFDTESLAKFLKTNKSGGVDVRAALIRETAKTSISTIRPYLLIFLFGAVALLTGGTARFIGDRCWASWKPLLTLAMPIGLFVLLVCVHLPVRVGIPVMIYILCVTLACGRRSSTAEGANPLLVNMGYAASVVALLCMAILGWKLLELEINAGKIQCHHKENALRCLREVTKQDPQAVAIRLSVSAAAFGYPFIDPIRDESRIPQIRSLAGGWKTASPRYRSVLQTIGVSSGREFLERSVDNGQILYVALLPHDEPLVQMVEAYLNRHLDETNGRLQFVPRYDFRDQKGVGPIFLTVRRQE